MCCGERKRKEQEEPGGELQKFYLWMMGVYVLMVILYLIGAWYIGS